MDPRAAAVDPAKVIARTVVVGGGGCWLWDGYVNLNGYGQFTVRVNGKATTLQAHRLSYELWVGPVPLGHEIDHLCRVRACVRPDHLEAVTHSVNVRRGVAPERTVAMFAAQAECKRGHALSGDNLYLYTDAAGYQHRVCLACRRATRRRAYLREREAA